MKHHIKVLEFDSCINNNKNNNDGIKGSKASQENPRLAMYKPKKVNQIKMNKSPHKNSNNNKPSSQKTTKQPISKQNNNKSKPISEPKKLNENIIQDKYDEVPYQENEPEDKIVKTIKYISENRTKFKRTNQILREIGQIANNPVVGFLMQKDFNTNPGEKLSAYISDKMLENNKSKLESNNINRPCDDPEEEYYKNLESHIKEEIKKKGTFDFSKLSDKDRKLLAQRKLYNRMGKKSIQDKTCDSDNKKEMEKVDEEEISRENKNIILQYKKENFFQDFEEKEPKLNKKPVNNNNEEKEEKKNDGTNTEKLSARQILENVLKKIEYKNQVLVNNNETRNKKK